jgi:hypothetical protein
VGVGAGDFVGPAPAAARQEHKTREVISKRKAIVCTRFIVFPLRVFTQHILHNLDFGALTAVDIRGEIE